MENCEFKKLSGICQECCHLIFENCCRCTEGKIIGCMYIDMVEGCIFYDTFTNTRCKDRVIETEYGKLSLCTEHTLNKKKKKINTDKSETNIINKKSSIETKKKETKKSNINKKKIIKKPNNPREPNPK